MTTRGRKFDDHPGEAVKAVEQLGMVKPDPERDRKAALNVASKALEYDNPAAVCGEVLDMLGLRPAPEIAAITRAFPHGSVAVAETGCACYRCGKTRQRRAVKS